MKKGFTLMRMTFEGFTLVELLLYVAIVSVVVTSLVTFGWNIIGNGTKSSISELVNNNGRFISEKIKYEIRNAVSVNSVSNSSISLSETDSLSNPTVISFASGDVSIKKGNLAQVSLNSNDTIVSNFTFTDYSSSDNKTKNIQFSFTISYKTSSTRQEYQVSDSFEGDGEIRSN